MANPYDNAREVQEGDQLSAEQWNRLVNRSPYGGGADSMVDMHGAHAAPSPQQRVDIRAFALTAALTPDGSATAYLLDWVPDATSGDWDDSAEREITVYDATRNAWGFTGDQGCAIRKPGGSGLGVWIVLVNPGQVSYWGRLNDTLAAGSSTTADLLRKDGDGAVTDLGEDITVYDGMLCASGDTNTSLATDTKVLIQMHAFNKRWYVTEANCDCESS